MKKLWFSLIAVLMLVGCSGPVGSAVPEEPDNSRTVTIVNDTSWNVMVGAGLLVPDAFGNTSYTLAGLTLDSFNDFDYKTIKPGEVFTYKYVPSTEYEAWISYVAIDAPISSQSGTNLDGGKHKEYNKFHFFEAARGLQCAFGFVKD